MSYLGEKLRALRGDRSLLKIEQGTGISRVQIMRFEKAERVPNPGNMRSLAEFFHVPYSELREAHLEGLYSNPEERAIVLGWAAKKTGVAAR